MKSQVKLLVMLMESLSIDYDCAISSRDVSELKKRATNEGLPFIASILPTLDDTLLEGLSCGEIRSNPNFPAKRGDSRPKFLNGLWSKVFTSDGSLIPSPCKTSIFAIRQISRAFKKVFEVCSDEKVDIQMESFKETDRHLPVHLQDGLVGRVNSILHGKWLYEMSRQETFHFGHGPGAVAERLDSVARWDFPTVSESQASRFDMSDFFVNYEEDWPCAVVPYQVGRVVAVPKTFDKPRLISIEPASAIFTQKGVLSFMDKHMVRIPQINMRSQERNRRLAQLGSLDGGLSTIDLSEASDRVSIALLREVFRLTPSALDLLLAVRTPAVDAGGEVVHLNKFASMGCALTFPVQMLVFRSIIIAAMCEQDGDTSTGAIQRCGLRPDVGVFGDDIIVPTHYASSVMQRLEALGLKVNFSKSFTTGLFRESCGGDFYMGTGVKPVYMRRMPPANRHDVDSIVSYAATSHLFAEIGLDHIAAYLSSLVQELIGTCPEGDGAISVSHPLPSKTRYNARLQRQEVLANVSLPKRYKTRATDRARLAAALHSAGREVIDPIRLTHHGRPTRAFISRRWVGRH